MTVPLRIFFIGGLTAYRGLINWLSPWIFFPTLVIAPIFQILLFVFIGRSAGAESDEFYVIGNAVQYASIPCLFSMTHAIAGERYQGTLTYILVTPAGRLPLFLGRALPVIVNAMPGLRPCSSQRWAMGGSSPPRWPSRRAPGGSSTSRPARAPVRYPARNTSAAAPASSKGSMPRA